MSSVSVSKNKAKTFVWASLNILVNISVTRLNSVALSKRASRKYICNPMRPSFRSAQWVLAQFAMISPMSWTAGSQCNLSLESVHKPYYKEKKIELRIFFFRLWFFFYLRHWFGEQNPWIFQSKCWKFHSHLTHLQKEHWRFVFLVNFSANRKKKITIR